MCHWEIPPRDHHGYLRRRTDWVDEKIKAVPPAIGSVVYEANSLAAVATVDCHRSSGCRMAAHLPLGGAQKCVVVRRRWAAVAAALVASYSAAAAAAVAVAAVPSEVQL
mmetsp:Transcript_59472/g.102423  ORF Transcript_59472/g.102423 Transcript_59472/m.102423 type:complete len:109 (-) Transcript_59472:77-403(-)